MVKRLSFIVVWTLMISCGIKYLVEDVRIDKSIFSLRKLNYYNLHQGYTTQIRDVDNQIIINIRIYVHKDLDDYTGYMIENDLVTSSRRYYHFVTDTANDKFVFFKSIVGNSRFVNPSSIIKNNFLLPLSSDETMGLRLIQPYFEDDYGISLGRIIGKVELTSRPNGP